MAFIYSIKTVVQGYHVYGMQQWMELNFLAKEKLVTSPDPFALLVKVLKNYLAE